MAKDSKFAHLSLEAVLAQNRGFHRNRMYWLEAEKRANNSMGAFIRTGMGYSLALPLSERNKIAKRAKTVVATAEKAIRMDRAWRKKQSRLADSADTKQIPSRPISSAEQEADYVEWGQFARHSIDARAHIDAQLLDAERYINELFKECHALQPIVAWWKEKVFHGRIFSLSVILGEAGNLSNYPSAFPEGHHREGEQRPAKHGAPCLWKRMGVAYMDEDGCAQGKLPKTAAKADWVRHGYNKRRRSRLYTIGDSIVKNSESHPYKRLYLERKSYEIQKFSNAGLRVLGAAEAKKQKDPYVPQIVVHLRAQRYVEKRLLKDLLGAWRRIQHQPAA